MILVLIILITIKNARYPLQLLIKFENYFLTQNY